MPLVTSFPRKLSELGRDWVGIGSGLGRDWVGIGSGWVGIGSGLGRDWVGIGSGWGFGGHDSQSCAFSNFWPSFALFRPILRKNKRTGMSYQHFAKFVRNLCVFWPFG